MQIADWVKGSAQIAAQPGSSAGRRSKSQTRDGRSEGAFNIDPLPNTGHASRYPAGNYLILIS